MYYTRDINSDEKIFDIRAEFPNVGFTANIPEDFLVANGLTIVNSAPDVNESNKQIVPVDIPYQENGKWLSYKLYPKQEKPTGSSTKKVVLLDVPNVDGGIYNRWEIVDRSEEELFSTLRMDRDTQLYGSDWTQSADYPDQLSDDKKAEWAEYRQKLRDLPATVDINNPIYPVKP
jgi:hypothetical protein